ncbi:MAG: hypothetical protein KF856_03880 [Cyclobacteriaceae bacterium]|nr:hypothetical protein [Cyclobacteriaceae bacterium]
MTQIARIGELTPMHSVYPQPTAAADNLTYRRVSMALIIDILRVSREIFYFINLLKRQPKADRCTLAVTLNEVSEVTKDTFDRLNMGVFPIGNCERLEELSGKLFFQIELALGPNHAQALADRLKHVHRVEPLHREFTSGAIDPRDLVLLDEAAGHFSASAKMLQV